MEDEVPSEGVFDLENLASFCAFAEFLRLVVLQSSSDLEESIRHHSTSSLNKLCAWRADNNIDCAASWMAEIARWSRHVLGTGVATTPPTAAASRTRRPKRAIVMQEEGIVVVVVGKASGRGEREPAYPRHDGGEMAWVPPSFSGGPGPE